MGGTNLPERGGVGGEATVSRLDHQFIHLILPTIGVSLLPIGRFDGTSGSVPMFLT